MITNVVFQEPERLTIKNCIFQEPERLTITSVYFVDERLYYLASEDNYTIITEDTLPIDIVDAH